MLWILRGATLLAGISAAGVLVLGVIGTVENQLDALSAVRVEALCGVAAAAAAALVLRLRVFAAVMMTSLLGGAVLLRPAWSLPHVLAPECVVDELTVATANIDFRNRPWAAVVDALMALDADLLTTQETSASFLRAADELRERYPFAWPDAVDASHGVVIWSKRPFLDTPQSHASGDAAPRYAGASIEFASAPLEILALHISRPIVDAQRADLKELSTIFQRMTGPQRLVLGDFNAAPWSDVVARIEGETRTTFRGGFLRTWDGRYPTPWRRLKIPAPFGNQIDHMLASPELHLDSFRVQDLPRSVHLAVVARLQATMGAGACRSGA